MDTLSSPPLPALLGRLFAEADASQPAMRAELDKLPAADWRTLMASRSEADYRGFYARARDLPLAVSRETGALLYILARAIAARSIVEFGASFGVSTLHLAAALRDNGGGRMITSEFEPAKAARARANLTAAGLDDLVELREGDATQTLARDLPATIDLVLLDGAKGLYPTILDLVEPRLRAGALVVADNADWSPDYLARVRDPARGWRSVPFGGEVELSMRTA